MLVFHGSTDGESFLMLDGYVDTTDQLSLIYLGVRVHVEDAFKAEEILKQIHSLMWDKRLKGQEDDTLYRYLHKSTDDTLKKQTENVENYLFEKYLHQYKMQQQKVYEDLTAAGVVYRPIDSTHLGHLEIDTEKVPKHQPIHHNPPQIL